jgi:hypothetical protein
MQLVYITCCSISGYGYSGPYPNTEYSSPVATAVDPSGLSDVNLGVASDALNVIETANYMREPNERGNIGRIHSSRPSIHGVSVPILEDTLTLSTSDSLSGSVSSANLESASDLSSGNFDLNLEFNGDLPGPFRRSGEMEGIIGTINPVAHTRKRKKISSTFKATQNQFKSMESTTPDILTT